VIYLVHQQKKAGFRASPDGPPFPRVAIPVSALACAWSRTGVPAPTESQIIPYGTTTPRCLHFTCWMVRGVMIPSGMPCCYPGRRTSTGGKWRNLPGIWSKRIGTYKSSKRLLTVHTAGCNYWEDRFNVGRHRENTRRQKRLRPPPNYALLSYW
jgi:hypothetical protein